MKLLVQNQGEMLKTGRLKEPYKGVLDCTKRVMLEEGPPPNPSLSRIFARITIESILREGSLLLTPCPAARFACLSLARFLLSLPRSIF